MSPWRLTDWWSRRSDPARIELYTRWTFYAFGIVEILWVGQLTTRSESPMVARVLLVTLLLLHGLLVLLGSGRALDWALDRRPRPTAELVACAGSGAAFALTVLVLRALDELPQEHVSIKVMLPLVFGIVPITINLSPSRMPRLLVGTTAVALVSAVALGLPRDTAFSLGLGTLVFGCGMAFTMRLSTWIVAVVWELDAARETQARLAVAEERLRFSRDLHDVLGRNLSVVALKSELAVQLAQRGEKGQRGAVTQMEEVQQIARDSQREVREVVRGYREAGLANELAGARGVLSSAGIDCEISTEGVEELSHPVQSVLGWVVREGTTNVLRHADAANCGIRLSIDRVRERAVLVVANNGAASDHTTNRTTVHTAAGAGVTADTADTADTAGRDPAGGGSGGSGLPGLGERLAELGGSVHAERRPNGTFRLTAEVPLTGETRSDAKVVTR